MASKKEKRQFTTKKQLDQQIALLLGMNVKKVATITNAFVEAIRAELVEMNSVRLEGLGILNIKTWDRHSADLHTKHTGHIHTTCLTTHRVSFRKSLVLTRALRLRHGRNTEITLIEKETKMEKYAVEEGQKDNEKLGSSGCPACGTKAERHGNTLMCPKCGTEPFEADKKR